MAHARVSPEKKIADALCNAMDSMSIEVAWVVEATMKRSSAIHNHIFDLCVGFLERYATMLDSGECDPGDNMSMLSIKSQRMVAALYEPTSTGRHAAP